jgi:hypothetical protein
MLALFLRAYSMGAGTVHRHRGGEQRAADHARAEGGDRAPDHVLMATSLSLDRRRHHPRLPLLHVSPVTGQT